MLGLRPLISLLLIVLTFCGCQRASEREAHRSQSLLDEADLLIEARMFDKAETNAAKALTNLDVLLEAQPDHVDFRLLHARANLVSFVAKNLLIIENAEPRARSLVRLPRPDEFIDYEKHIKPAEENLKGLLAMNVDFSTDQQAFIHGTLAAIFRLNDNTLEDASKEYEKAAAIYEELLQELKSEDMRIGSNDFAMMRTENDLNGIRMAQAEVLILAEKWSEALDLLKSVMAGDDLKYFTVHFQALEEQISRLENLLKRDEQLSSESREAVLLQKIQDKKAKKNNLLVQLGGIHPRKIELIQARIQLSDAQNNLMYRIICLYNLGDEDELDEARKVLRGYYPELETELFEQLQTYK